MGFSVSGSMVVILLGLFIALSAYYGSVSNNLERINDAQAIQDERSDRIQDANFNITSVSLLSEVACGVQIQANNTGSEPLQLTDTDLLLDNEYRQDWQRDAVVASDTFGDEPGTDLWFPGERLTIEDTSIDAAPRSVKLVSGPGLAQTREVTAAC